VAFNNEVDAIILGRDTAAAMETLLDRNRARGTRIDLASWRARGLCERPRELIARLWQFVL
jgi:cardiolipin synthase